MSDPRQPTALIARVAARMKETISVSSDYFNYENVLQALNEEQGELCRDIFNLDVGWFLTSTQISFVAGQQEYAIPANCARIKKIVINDSWKTPVQISSFLDFPEHRQLVNPLSPAGITVALRENFLRLSSTAGVSSANAWTMWYFRNPIDMLIFTVSSGSGTGILLPATPTVGLTSSIPGYYKDGWVLTTGGTGLGQERQCTSYAAETRVMTVATWTVNPDATTTAEVLSELRSEETEVLVLGAIRRLMAIDGEAALWERDHRSSYERLRDKLMRDRAKRQVASPRLTRLVV